MNFIKNIFLLLVSPSTGWAEIKKFNVPKEIMLSRVFYPLLAILAISSLALFFYSPGNTLAFYIQNSVICFATYFFGYLTASYFLNSLYPKLSDDPSSANRFSIFIIYCYTILVIIAIINNALNNFVFFEILPLYIVFIVWKGIQFLKIETDAPKFVVIVSCMILLPPLLIDLILKYLLPLNS